MEPKGQKRLLEKMLAGRMGLDESTLIGARYGHTSCPTVVYSTKTLYFTGSSQVAKLILKQRVFVASPSSDFESGS